ncbi:sigma-70 family RNA polymerase sigma factor [Aureibaculum sp. A20]|uniref:Sigma-70 family RNA polymerase sigma factor n=1 Tax=Aureibaculum flavum TaxID=2795986 RepID=A0ABS0WUP0_9FLAO|nr:sigma-70 family RNA polymerase sigma factor [Aureibaculum flavum]MBJ2175685.1 sigma-70 family RNA polymerase sigma factor [Aureibaculum flavum]
MEDTLKYKKQHNEFRVIIAQAFPDLVQLKKEEDKKSFNELVLKILPEINKYIVGRLNSAIKNGHFSKNKYKPDDFIDQLFIEIYDHIDAFDNQKDFYLWLFKKTNALLEDTIEEEEFDNLFLKNIDIYTKPEWDEMEENYTVDAGGDLLLIEELDDISYNHNDYTLNHVFIENKEDKLVKKLDKELSKERIHTQIAMVLQKLPMAMNTVFELFTNYKFTAKEIAEIRNSSVTEVEKLLEDARKAIRLSFFNRYAINK